MATGFQRNDGRTIRVLTTHLAASINPGIDWAAYEQRPHIGANDERVPGLYYLDAPASVVNYDEISRMGNKVPEAVARFFFRGVEEKYRS